MLDVGCRMLDVGCQMLDVRFLKGRKTGDRRRKRSQKAERVGCRVLDVGCRVSEAVLELRGPCKGRSLIAQGFNPGFKGLLFDQRWPGIVIRRRRLSASKMKTR